MILTQRYIVIIKSTPPGTPHTRQQAPRGLASIVINKGVPEGKFIAMVVVLTVFFSLVAHGVSANPLARLLEKKEGKKADLA